MVITYRERQRPYEIVPSQFEVMGTNVLANEWSGVFSIKLRIGIRRIACYAQSRLWGEIIDFNSSKHTQGKRVNASSMGQRIEVRVRSSDSSILLN